MNVRRARVDDAQRVASIYNEGIEEREATFETDARSADDMARQIRSPDGPFLVAEDGSDVVGWAAVGLYSDRPAYAGVGECALYVEREHRRRGVARRLLDELAAEAERAGYHKLTGKLFTTNAASIALVHRCGFRSVGVHLRHGRLHGEWRDVLVVERLVGAAAGE